MSARPEIRDDYRFWCDQIISRDDAIEDLPFSVRRNQRLLARARLIEKQCAAAAEYSRAVLLEAPDFLAITRDVARS